MTKKERPHADTIRRWAEDHDAVVEYRLHDYDVWKETLHPQWEPAFQFRIRPAPKKTVEMWQWLCRNNSGSNYWATSHFYRSESDARREQGANIAYRLDWTRIEVTED